MSRAIAFFDVDDTILKGSSGLFLARMMVFDRGETISLGEVFDTVKAFLASRAGSVEYDDLVEKFLGRFEGQSLAEVEDVAKECFDKYMRKAIYRGAYKEIARHKKEGNLVVFITASLKLLVEPLGDFLGADEIIALKPIFEDHRLTTRAEKPYSYEDGKRILAIQYAEEQGVDLKDCSFYSDSISDLPLMEQVGHPTPTNPDPKLLAVALMRNYRVLFCRTVLPPNFKPKFATH